MLINSWSYQVISCVKTHFCDLRGGTRKKTWFCVFHPETRFSFFLLLLLFFVLLPQIAKDAKECVQECVSEFISFITSEASERCHQEKRKTINGEDILFAMSTLGFDMYVDPLKLYLQKFREVRPHLNYRFSVLFHFGVLLYSNLWCFFVFASGDEGREGDSRGPGGR